MQIPAALDREGECSNALIHLFVAGSAANFGGGDAFQCNVDAFELQTAIEMLYNLT